MKKVLIMLIVPIFFMACNQAGKTSQSNCICNNAITVDSFLNVAQNFVDKEICVTGTVDHVCKHGAMRVRLYSGCPDNSIHGFASEQTGKFCDSIEGKQICIKGIVVEDTINLEYVNNWENSINQAIEKNAAEPDMEHATGADHHATLAKVQNYRNLINQSKNGYISFYSIKVNQYVTVPQPNKKCCNNNTTNNVATDSCKNADTANSACCDSVKNDSADNCCNKTTTKINDCKSKKADAGCTH